MIRVRLYESADEAFVVSLASRLAIGRPPWRNEALWEAAVQGWAAGSMEMPQPTLGLEHKTRLWWVPQWFTR